MPAAGLSRGPARGRVLGGRWTPCAFVGRVSQTPCAIDHVDTVTVKTSDDGVSASATSNTVEATASVSVSP